MSEYQWKIKHAIKNEVGQNSPLLPSSFDLWLEEGIISLMSIGWGWGYIQKLMKH
jgi:hypothetical protein